jgi:hypothetical protein
VTTPNYNASFQADYFYKRGRKKPQIILYIVDLQMTVGGKKNIGKILGFRVWPSAANRFLD